METKEARNTTLKCDGEVYEIVIKEIYFINGYKLVRLLVNSRRYWAIKGSDSWRLMSDYSISSKLKDALLKEVEAGNTLGLRLVLKSQR